MIPYPRAIHRFVNPEVDREDSTVSVADGKLQGRIQYKVAKSS